MGWGHPKAFCSTLLKVIELWFCSFHYVIRLTTHALESRYLGKYICIVCLKSHIVKSANENLSKSPCLVPILIIENCLSTVLLTDGNLAVY